MSRIISLVVILMFSWGCAATKPISPFLMERNIFKTEEPATKKKSVKDASDKETEALAKLSVFINTDPYKTAPRILLGKNVYEEILEVVGNQIESKYDADTISFARGVSFFRLRYYAEAAKELSRVKSESAFNSEALKYLEAASVFGAVPRVTVRPVAAQGDLNLLHSALNGEREAWYALAKDPRFEEFIRSTALEEIERIDLALFGLIAEYNPNQAEEALGYLVVGHHNSKNFLRNKLSVAYLMLWKLEYLEAQNSASNKEIILKISGVVEKTLREVANEDGTVEKLAAKRLLEVFMLTRRNLVLGGFDAKKK